MSWYDTFLSAPRRAVISFAEAIADFGENLSEAIIATASPEAPPRATRRENRKRRREIRREKRQSRRPRKRRGEPTEPPSPSPRPSSESPVEHEDYLLVRGNIDVVSVENERGSYPNLILGLEAYKATLQSIGDENMVALVHWFTGRLPYVLYVGYPEV